MKMYCVLLSVIFLMSHVTMVVSVGNSTRYYENGTSVTCLGIVCPLDEIFVPCTHSLGDGKHDTCESCPFDRPRTLNIFDSSAFGDPPVDFACRSVLERCECAEEAELVNPLNCTKTLEPVCKCNTTAGYYGQDPNACQLSENKQCKLPGYELKQDGSCDECPGGTYKNTYQFGRCLLQPRCHRPLVVDHPGDSVHRRTCKLPVTTPPPDKRVTTRESTSAADMEYSTLSNSTLNVTASTNQTSPLLDPTNFEWIDMYLVPVVAVVAVVLLIVVVFICVNRRKKRLNKNRRQDKRHQKDGDCDGLIENGMGNRNLLHSVNRNQQGNSGDSHKLSCGFKMFTRMICPKTCGSFKWYEQVKTTTKNEEKNTVDGDRTSDVDEIKEKGNSNGITEKGNSNGITEKGNSNGITEKGNSNGITKKGNSNGITEKPNSNGITEKGNSNGITEKGNSNGITEKGNSNGITEKGNSNGITEKGNSNGITEKGNSNGITEKGNSNGITEKGNSNGITEKGNSNGITEKGNSNGITEKGNSNGITEKGNSNGITEKGNSDGITEKGNSNGITEKGNSNKIVEKGNSDKIVENEDGTFIEVNVDDTSEKVIGRETAENVTIESRENTTTNSCATEIRDASYGRLDIGSLISSGKTSSGFVDDMHILKWSPSSSKGFIECTDTSGKRFKSIAIHNGSQGMILLKMKDIGKGCKFIFVSSSENSKIESYVEVGVEPVRNNLDLSTLLKSGLSTLDFSSSEFVQNRPEEDSSSHRLQKGSLDQPNHISLQHSQNQADSGISDTMPAECSNQAGDSFSHLSLGSFDNDEN